MQASAASQTVSPANIPSQAKADVHKTDAASPFAILVDVASAKDSAKPAKTDAKDSGDRSADDKAAVGRNDDRQKDNSQNDIKQKDTSRDAAQTASTSKPAAPAKNEKADKDKDGAKTDKDAPDDKQVAAAEQPPSDQQVQPPVPVVQASIAVPAGMDAGTDTETQKDIVIDGAAPATKTAAPLPGTDLPQSDPVDAAAKPQTDTTTQPQVAAQADDTETAESVAAQSAAAPPADAKPPVAARDSVKPAAVKTAAKAVDTAGSDTVNVEPAKDELAHTDAAQKSDDETVHGAPANPAKTDIAKDDSTNVSKAHTAHDNIASNAKVDNKADNSASDNQKADTAQAGVRPAETEAAPAAAKPVPQSASVSNSLFAINNIAAPQAAQHAQAPTATQHVQVTAQPAPNLPALAVEISAKSQSGAKQFDIRLDPPELGRVEVRLSIDATGKASAHLSADQPQTLTLLQKDAPILTRALREAGLDVSQDGLNFSLRQQAQDQNGNDGNNGRFGGARSFALAATASIDPTAASFAYRGVADGRVDIRV